MYLSFIDSNKMYWSMHAAIVAFSDAPNKDNFIFESLICDPYLTSKKSCALSGVVFWKTGIMKKEK